MKKQMNKKINPKIQITNQKKSANLKYKFARNK